MSEVTLPNVPPGSTRFAVSTIPASASLRGFTVMASSLEFDATILAEPRASVAVMDANGAP